MQRFGIVWILSCLSLIFSVQISFGQVAETLVLNEPVSGTLAPESSVLYTFAIPVTQDVTVTYESDKFIMSGHTVTTTTPDDSIVESQPAMGGAGSDSPSTGFFIIPAYQLSAESTDTLDDVERQIELMIVRPLDTPADYTVTVQTVDPIPLTTDTPQIITPTEDDETPFQLFVIESPYETPFVVQMQEFGKNQIPHMVDYIPPLLRPYDTVPYSETPLIYANFFSVDRWGNEPDNREVTAYYAGGNSFRLKVDTPNPYTISFQPLAYNDLSENQPHTIVVSGDVPLQMFRLNVGNRQSVTVNARIISGTGAEIILYAVDDVRGWEAVRVGNGVSSTGSTLPQEDSITVPITMTGQVELSVMLNSLFTGNQAVVELDWNAN